MRGYRGNKEIWLRKGMAGFSSFFHQNAPLQKYVFGHRQGALTVKHRADLEREPILQSRALLRIGTDLYAVSNLRQAYMLTYSSGSGVVETNSKTFRSGLGFPQLRNDVGIKQRRH